MIGRGSDGEGVIASKSLVAGERQVKRAARETQHEPVERLVPLVSVAIACYNQARFLAAAIESVRAQSYPQVEIIVVDDGSTDETAAVAARFEGVRYVYQANQGLSAARNTGLQHSRGEYVVFLDADDRLLPRALEVGVLCLITYRECAFASGHFRYINADGSMRHQYPQNRVARDHYLALLRGNYIGMHATVLYRRAVFDEVGGFDTTLRACEDYDLYLRIARRFPVFCHDEITAEYRQHGANMSSDPVMMLGQALHVLRRQWPHVRRDGARLRAYGVGTLAWEAHYGEQLLAQTGQEVTDGRVNSIARKLMAGLRRAPLYTTCRAAEAAYWQGYQLLYRLASPQARQRIAHLLYQASAPAVGTVRWGALRTRRPLAHAAAPELRVDQHYIDEFVAGQAHYLRGSVLHIGREIDWTEVGGAQIEQMDRLPLDGEPEPLLDSLDALDKYPANHFDCILLLHALHRVYDLRGALRTLYRLLKPGGVLLVTLPGVALVKTDAATEAGYWTFTEYAAQMLFGEQFGGDLLRIEAQGNVLAAVALLHGQAAQTFTPSELAYRDPQYQLVVTVKAIKPDTSAHIDPAVSKPYEDQPGGAR